MKPNVMVNYTIKVEMKRYHRLFWYVRTFRRPKQKLISKNNWKKTFFEFFRFSVERLLEEVTPIETDRIESH